MAARVAHNHKTTFESFVRNMNHEETIPIEEDFYNPWTDREYAV